MSIILFVVFPQIQFSSIRIAVQFVPMRTKTFGNVKLAQSNDILHPKNKFKESCAIELPRTLRAHHFLMLQLRWLHTFAAIENKFNRQI